jgi:HSP20 family protein
MTLISFAKPNALHKHDRLSPEFADFYRNYLNTVNQCRTLPAVNIIEQPTSFVLQIAAPGYSKNDFDIKVEKDSLVISAKAIERKDENVNYTRCEFGYEEFERNFKLGKTIDSSQVDARYVNGILELTLKKREEAIPKPPMKVEIL